MGGPPLARKTEMERDEMDEHAPALSIWHLTGYRSGQVDRFVHGRVAIGRGSANHLSFDPQRDRSVSHRHCEIRLESDGLMIYDVGSLNGTFVNGQRVRRAVLTDGDEVGLGREGPRLRIALGGEEVSSVPPPVVDRTTPISSPRTRPILPRGARSTLLVASGLVALVALAGIVGLDRWRDSGVEARLSQLERNAGMGGGPISDGTMRPSVLDGPRAAQVLVRATIYEADGSVRLRRELGTGVATARGRLLTTRGVAVACAQFLQRTTLEGTRSAVEASPEDEHDSWPIVGHWLSAAHEGAVSHLALLEVQGGPPGVVGSRPVHVPMPAQVTWFPPAQERQQARVERLLDEGGYQVAGDGEVARMFALDHGPDVEGTPLFGADEQLVGIALGRNSGHVVLAPAAIRDLVDEVTSRPATPF